MNKIIIAIDAFRLISEPRTSGAFVVYEIVQDLIKQESVRQVILLLPREPNREFLFQDLLSLDKISVLYPEKPHFPENNFRSTVKWIQFVIPNLINNTRITHLISPYHQTPILLSSSIRSITIIHDICGILPSAGYNYYKKSPYRHWFNFFTSIIRANAFVFISNYTKLQFEKHFPIVRKRPSVICYPKPTLTKKKDQTYFRILKDLGLKYKDYFFAYGSCGVRKGTDLSLKAFINYKECGGKKNLVLLVSNSSLPFFRKNIKNIKHPIRLLSDLSNQERDAVYFGATALIFPSRCEGFGYPVLEAMYYGCPPIAHINSPAKEIMNGCVKGLKTLNIDEILELMFDYEHQGEVSRQLMSEMLQLRATDFIAQIGVGEKYLDLMLSLKN
jgi:glycosyltransferase involved in cell wall biosynthesis